MEDKWFIYADGPDVSGSATINFHRSWTGLKVAEVDIQIKCGKDDNEGLWTGQIVALTIEKDSTPNYEDGNDDDEPKNIPWTALHPESNEKLLEETKPAKEPGRIQESVTQTSQKSSTELEHPQLGRNSEHDISAEEELGGDFIIFQVLTTCEWVLETILVEEIKEPDIWKKMSKPVEATYSGTSDMPKNVYKGVTLSKDTEEDIKRLGGMQEMFRKTAISFTV